MPGVTLVLHDQRVVLDFHGINIQTIERLAIALRALKNVRGVEVLPTAPTQLVIELTNPNVWWSQTYLAACKKLYAIDRRLEIKADNPALRTALDMLPKMSITDLRRLVLEAQNAMSKLY